ncbi:MAG: tRNA (cytidine(56)-2'-O)-methyltransferase [Candidatus Aenigmarchaeota archaeon]|nr:tRNA (cytidine(56)-2'-O)-methyltransferase [Candidatus Aenigmarchaeota archaeon]
MGIWILRLGHRRVRDQRITSHCALVARAFGAKGITYSGEKDENLEKSIRKVVEKWGGPFEIRYEKNQKKIIKDWKGKIVHLTMYGLPIQDVINEIKGCKKDLLVIIGSQRVPGKVYNLSNWNVAVTNQPHSEVASLAVFLDKFFGGMELEKEFENKKIKIIPLKRGKKVLKV